MDPREILQTTRKVLFVFFLVFMEVSGNKWSYKGKAGPEFWHKLFTTCSGKRQSPINIISKETIHEPKLTNFAIWFDPPHPQDHMIVINNGHTVKVKTVGKFYITNGGLPNVYKTAQLHFHWGPQDDIGSEHQIDSVSYPLELHIVNFDHSKYTSLHEAMTKEFGLAVLGVMFKVTEEDNPVLNPIIDVVEEIQKPGHPKIRIKAQSIRNFLPKDISKFYRYHGSLTTPGCYETVIWTIFKQANHISHRQMKKLRRLFYNKEVGGHPDHHNHHHDHDKLIELEETVIEVGVNDKVGPPALKSVGIPKAVDASEEDKKTTEMPTPPTGDDAVDNIQIGDRVANTKITDSVVNNNKSDDSVAQDSKNGASTVNDSKNGASIVNDSKNGVSVVNNNKNGDSVVNDSKNGDSIVNDSKNGDNIVNDSKNGASIVNDRKNGDSIIQDSNVEITTHLPHLEINHKQSNTEILPKITDVESKPEEMMTGKKEVIDNNNSTVKEHKFAEVDTIKNVESPKEISEITRPKPLEDPDTDRKEPHVAEMQRDAGYAHLDSREPNLTGQKQALNKHRNHHHHHSRDYHRKKRDMQGEIPHNNDPAGAAVVPEAKKEEIADKETNFLIEGDKKLDKLEEEIHKSDAIFKEIEEKVKPHKTERIYISDNYRPIQPLNGRLVLRSFPSFEEDPILLTGQQPSAVCSDAESVTLSSARFYLTLFLFYFVSNFLKLA